MILTTTSSSAIADGNASYPWCKELSADRATLSDAMGENFDHALPAIAVNLCSADGEMRGKRNELEARRQRWMKQLAMSEADWAKDVVEWSNIPYSQRNTPRVDAKEKVAWSTMDPVEQFAILSKEIGMSNAFALQPGAKPYIADAVQLSEAGRVAYLEGCLRTAYDTDIKPVEWAVCQPDIEALDGKKLGAELASATSRTAFERMTIRRAYAWLQAKLPAHAKKVQALRSTDPAYDKMFAIAKTARTEWAAGVKERAELLSLVLLMDDARAANSNKAYAGCSDKAWPAFQAAVAKLGAKRFENIRAETREGVSFYQNAMGAVLGTVDGYLAANALIACEGARDPLTSALSGGIRYWAGYRGPRTAGIMAIRFANLEFDDRDTKLEIPSSSLTLANAQPTKASGDGVGEGVIAAVKAEGDVVRITFPKSSATHDVCVSSKKTNRISRIDDNGNVYYESTCLKFVTEKYDSTPTPITVDKRYAAALKPGVFISAYGGAVAAVWAKANSPTPLAVFGTPVK